MSARYCKPHFKKFPKRHLLFFIVSTVCILVSNIFHVNAIGAYLYPYRGTVGSMKPAGAVTSLESIKNQQHAAKELKDADEFYAKCNGIDIRELTIVQVQQLFATNQLTSMTLTECYLKRINRMNPLLNAIIELNPDAIKQAYDADVELFYAKSNGGRRKDGSSSLMLGIPILLKDNIATNDSMETTAGSLALVGLRPKRDADVVKALRKAGAVILGKANLSEFAYFRGTNEPSGWSQRGGQTKNAYNLGADPSGSSSGSAVAVSANLAMVSLGTDTDGSLIAPSSVGSLFTIKPTLKSVSTKGVIPISHNQDNVGPMTRTAMDMAILLDTLMPLENSVQSAYKDPQCKNSYTGCILGRTHNKRRIGIVRYPFWDSSILNSTDLLNELPILENTLSVLKSSPYFDIVDPVVYPIDLITRISGEKEFIVLTHDFKHEINEYLKNDVTSSVHPRRIRDLVDIIKFNNEHPNAEGYSQDLLLAAQATDGLQNKTYVKALQSNRMAAQELLNFLLTTYKLDALMTPTVPHVEDVFDPRLLDAPIVGWSVAAIAGYPMINVPAGTDKDGVPFGLTFIGMSHTEPMLVQIAYLMEKLAPRRHPPLFLA